MTIRVKIGPIEKDISEVDDNWINEQINRRRGADGNVCVQVTIEHESINLRLSSAGCPNTGGGTRPLRKEEDEIENIWRKMHLYNHNFSGGNLVAFLNQIKRLI